MRKRQNIICDLLNPHSIEKTKGNFDAFKNNCLRHSLNVKS